MAFHRGKWKVDTKEKRQRSIKIESLLEIMCTQSSRKQRKAPFRPAFGGMYPKEWPSVQKNSKKKKVIKMFKIFK